jgi:anti-sigma B factor antagonist
MDFKREKTDNYDIIHIAVEKLDNSVAPELKSEFTLMNKEGVKNLIIDLTNVKYCDSSGLSAILVANRLCKNSNGHLVLAGTQESVKKLITISQLDSVFHIMPTVAESIDLLFVETIQNKS